MTITSKSLRKLDKQLVLIILTFFSISNLDAQNLFEPIYQLKFGPNGQFYGQSREFINRDKIVASIQFSTDEFHDEVQQIVDDHFAMIHTILENKKAFKDLGLESQIPGLCNELLMKIQSILDTYPLLNTRSNGYYDYQLSYYKSLIPDTVDPDPTSYFPNLFDLLPNNDSYVLEMVFYDIYGLPIRLSNRCKNCSETTLFQPLTIDCPKGCETHGLVLTTNKISVPDKAVRFTYNLRKTNYVYSFIQRKLKSDDPNRNSTRVQISSNSKVSDKVIKGEITLEEPGTLITEKYKIKKGRITTTNYIHDHETFEDFKPIEGPIAPKILEIDKYMGQVSTAIVALESYVKDEDGDKLCKSLKDFCIETDIPKINLAAKDWVLHMLWINKGIPSLNPLNLYFNPKKEDISDQEKLLARLKVELEYFDKLLQGDKLKLSDFTSSTKDQGTRYVKVKTKVLELEKSITKAKKSNQGVSSANTKKRQLDELLYQGLLMPNRINQRNYMRHHDALNEYSIMGPYVTEISEKDKMNILVHNLKSSGQIDISFDIKSVETLTPVEVDIRALPFEGIDENSFIPEVLPSEEGCCDRMKEKLKENLSLLKRYKALMHGGKKVLRLPPVAKPDSSPNFFTKEWDHDRPTQFSSLVAYEIKSGKAPNQKTEYKGEYRMNKLFRFRFKAGPIYSTRPIRDYTIDATTNMVTLDEGTYGLNATAGVQFFFDREGIDIRQRRMLPVQKGWFGYLGLAMGEDISRNWMIGGGKELFSGLGVMIGAHMGRTEKLDESGAVPIINKDKFNTGFFTAVLVDVSVFQRFFNLGKLENPLKN